VSSDGTLTLSAQVLPAGAPLTVHAYPTIDVVPAREPQPFRSTRQDVGLTLLAVVK
jgi:hypothetical protein